MRTASGMLNSIGLQNPGVDFFAENDLPFLRKFDTKIIVNACGSTIDEYVELAKVLNKLDIDGVELNLSCPNVKAGCMAFGNTYEGVKEVTSRVRKVLDKPLIVKLTPKCNRHCINCKSSRRRRSRWSFINKHITRYGK